MEDPVTAFDRTLIPSSPDLTFESPLWAQGWRLAGLDEAGRGAWAGPVVAAALILPSNLDLLAHLNGVRDSKQLTPAKRESLAAAIHDVAAAWGVGMASNVEIDSLGIIPATRLAMARALNQLSLPVGCLLLDAIFLPENALPQVSLIKGDQRSLSVAAASILAKTSRDAWMVEASNLYGVYGFDRHKGYGTRAHQQALQDYGACPLHRLSFKPIKALA
jgi:ribonuclease HII